MYVQNCVTVKVICRARGHNISVKDYASKQKMMLLIEICVKNMTLTLIDHFGA